MTQLVIHLGTPRTGITVLQKHLFSRAVSNIIYSKRAYKPSGRVTDKERSTFTKEQEQSSEIEITQALKQYDFYDRITKAQMFE